MLKMKLQHAEVVTSAISAINLGKALRSDPTEVHSMRSLNDRAYCQGSLVPQRIGYTVPRTCSMNERNARQ